MAAAAAPLRLAPRTSAFGGLGQVSPACFRVEPAIFRFRWIGVYRALPGLEGRGAAFAGGCVGGCA